MKLTRPEKLLLLSAVREHLTTCQSQASVWRLYLDNPERTHGARLEAAKSLECAERDLVIAQDLLAKLMKTPAVG